MRLRYRILIILFGLSAICLFIPGKLFSQELSNLREKNISDVTDTVKFDTLSIVPNTVEITSGSGTLLDSTQYALDYSNALIIWNIPKDHRETTISVSYRVFPYSLSPISFNSCF